MKDHRVAFCGPSGRVLCDAHVCGDATVGTFNAILRSNRLVRPQEYVEEDTGRRLRADQSTHRIFEQMPSSAL